MVFKYLIWSSPGWCRGDGSWGISWFKSEERRDAYLLDDLEPLDTFVATYVIRHIASKAVPTTTRPAAWPLKCFNEKALKPRLEWDWYFTIIYLQYIYLLLLRWTNIYSGPDPTRVPFQPGLLLPAPRCLK